MKSYQWVAVNAAIAITALQGWLFGSANSIVSPVETHTGVVSPESVARKAVAAERAGRADAPVFGEPP